MSLKQLLVLGGTVLMSLGAPAVAQHAQEPYVQIAEIEIDPAQLEAYHAAVKEQAEAAIRLEPGVLVLYAVSQKDNPTQVRVFEVYRDTDAYRSHLEAAHFKKYKATTETMVKSLKLIQVSPIALGAQGK